MAEQATKPHETAAAAPQDARPDAAPQQPKGRPCPKDCTKCNFQQHAYCAAKMSFDAFTVMSAMMQRLDAQSAAMADMAARLKAIEGAEAELAAPEPVQGDLFPEED